MQFLHQESGEITFSDGFYLYAGQSARDLLNRPIAIDGMVFPLGMHPLSGGSLWVTGTFLSDKLASLTLFVDAVVYRSSVSMERGRAFLFTKLHFKDPCPDTHQSVAIRCPFGDILIASDPYTGEASARITYQKNR